LFILFIIASHQPTQAQQGTQSLQSKVDALNDQAAKTSITDAGKALPLLFESAALAKEIGYYAGLASAYYIEADIYEQSGYNKKALSQFYKMMELAKEKEDAYNQARAKQRIAVLTKDDEGLESSVQRLQETVEVFETASKPWDIANSYNHLSLLFMELRKFDSAKFYLDAALKQSIRNGYLIGQRKANFNYGLLHLEQSQYDSAHFYILKSMALEKTQQDMYGVAQDKIMLARLHNAKGDYNEAISNAKEAFGIAENIGALKLVTTASEEIVDAYQHLNNNAEVIHWQQKLIATQQDIAEDEKSYATELLETIRSEQAQNAAFEKQVVLSEQKAQKRNVLFGIVASAFLIICALAYFLYLNFEKAKRFSSEVATKNKMILDASQKLELANSEVTHRNKDLDQSNRMKDKLLSIISHDLRHPLVNTKGILELSRMELISHEELPGLLGDLEMQYVRSLALLDNLLYWIRGQMNGGQMNLVPLNLKQLAEDIIEEQKLALDKKSIKVSLKMNKQALINGDKEMVKVIFRNLIYNAIKFTPDNGIILVEGDMEGEKVFFSVKDNGRGMSDEVLQKLTSKEYFTSTGTKNEVGSGFGIILIRDLIERHQGRLEIKSVEGIGSNFTVVFEQTANKAFSKAA
jgi:two-component system, sensor histidine kinase and response regulator